VKLFKVSGEATAPFPVDTGHSKFTVSIRFFLSPHGEPSV
jgi:hypothetical protein